MKAKLGVMLTLLFVAAVALKAWPGNEISKGGKQAVIYNFELKSINGKQMSLSQYRGKSPAARQRCEPVWLYAAV